MGKPVARKPAAEDNCSAEESGWTAYFQDFSNNINNDNNNNNADDDEDDNIVEESFCTNISSSLVSDAASYAAWKLSPTRRKNSPQHHHHETPKKLSFKKTRAKEISQDDSLEDTASSPVNSPKVGDLKAVDMKAKQRDDLIDDSLGKRGTSEYYSELQPEERRTVDFNGENDCLDLKKRGLCLVPLSMLVNYLG
ncbi:hypothetical protein L484_018253 [Morus notabilis]|uniref:Uncharacterized protein n=2 Tax=Morus notabilis TaxID=981085 RepID=W9S2M0_9ROSA|nr:hypothetical protein L484_018253 [Morus notabilis]